VARALIVGCGCRGRTLGARLAAEGVAVRGTAREPAGLAAIEAVGFDAAQADPHLPGTMLDLVGDVAIVIWLLGSAVGETESVEAIHGERLEHLISRLVDTPVRGFAYEAAGTAGETALGAGRSALDRAAATWSIPVAYIESAPPGGEDAGTWEEWSATAAESVLALLR
jgi:hypothetical protein